MATPRRSETLTPARRSTSQASRTTSQTEGSAARCCIFRGQKLKLLKDDQLANTQPQSDGPQASNGVNFKYSARRSAASVSASVTHTAPQRALATQGYGRNTISHLYYLDRKIKLINSKADLFRPELESAYSRLCCKIDVYSNNLNRRVATMRRKGIRGDILETRLKLLNAKKDSYTEDLKRKIDLLDAKKLSYYGEILRHIRLLICRLHPFDEKFSMHIDLIESKLKAFVRDIDERAAQLSGRYESYTNAFTKELRDVDIHKCNCGMLVTSPSARNVTAGDNV